MPRSHIILRCFFVVLIAFAPGLLTFACSVPVFRYALEHWQSDPYVAIVFHRGELTEEQQTLVKQLRPEGDAGYPIANIIVRTVDLDDEPSDVILDLWKQHETDTLPLLSLQTPPKLGPPQTAWQGELTSENVSRITDSPAREQLRQRLLGGESVVWLFLESGKQAQDDEAFALLTEEVARLQDEIELPPIEEQDLADLSVDPTALKIGFSAIRLSREDAQEQPLIEMLLRVEPDLLDEPYVSQPMAFPVFGRGRTLYALVGNGITAETIEDASRFLAGACQCTVKAQNPGVDLLMAVDWDQHVHPALPYDDSQPPLTGLGSFARSTADGETTHHGSAAAENAVAANDPPSVEASNDVQTEPPLESAKPAAVVVTNPATAADVEAASVDSLTRNIAVLLGLMIAGVVITSVIVSMKK